MAGEISTSTYVDIPRIARDTIRRIGYTRAKYGFDADTCGVSVAIDEQSPDIAQGVDEAFEVRGTRESDRYDAQGAGDQGLMFGYATDETPGLMPLPVTLAHRMCERLAAVRRDGMPYLRPDGKSQVTVRYEDGRPTGVDAVVVSTQHQPDISNDLLRDEVIRQVIRPVLEEFAMWRPDITTYINPTGNFVVGGPMGDCGLTGRKIIVDTYGGMARHGGGAFSGKDPSKVDRSACYAARWVAKNVVAAGLAAPLRGPGGLRHRRGPPGLGHGRHLRHRDPRHLAHRAVGAEELRPAPGGHHRHAGPAPPDLPEDGGLRPLRAQRPGLHLGAHRRRRRAGRPLRRRRGLTAG